VAQDKEFGVYSTSMFFFLILITRVSAYNIGISIHLLEQVDMCNFKPGVQSKLIRHLIAVDVSSQ
jgi:hypothetical protein